MFKDNPNFIKLDEEIYVWENFLSPEEHQRFFDLALSISEEEWLGHVNPNKFWSGKCSLNKKEVYEIYLKLNTANKHKMDPIPVCLIPEKLR